jgi:hypothetical protein
MGSGAFLVAAAVISPVRAIGADSGRQLSALDIGERERAAFRRTVAQRCLFGVDINPMAVQLGRLSLWLATLAGDRPLTFLDHHLRAGNSLLGASLDDVVRQAPGGHCRRARAAHLPLFDLESADAAMTAPSAAPVSPRSGDTIEGAGERALLVMQQTGGPLGTWKAVADLVQWFASRPAVPAFSALVDGCSDETLCPVNGAPLLVKPPRSTARRFFVVTRVSGVFRYPRPRGGAWIRRRDRQSPVGDAARRTRHGR